MERLLPKWAYKREREYFQWRSLSVDDAVRFGWSFFVLQMGLGLVCGVFLGGVHAALLKFFGGGGMTLLIRMVEALLIALWPLSLSARLAEKLEEGKSPSVFDLLPFKNIFSLLVVTFALFALALGGALLYNQIAVWIWPDYFFPLWRHLWAPPSLVGAASVYPMLFLGALTLARGFFFAPFVAIHEGGGPFEVLGYSLYASRELKWAMFFLLGYGFITVTGALILLVLIPNDSSYSSDMLEASVIGATALVNGFVWNSAYGQAMALEKPRQRFSVLKRRRYVVDI
jgi:hypothetical protein